MATKKLTKDVLVTMLAKDLVRRYPDMAAHPADARYNVSHWGGAGPCTLRDLALKARNAELISEEEYLRAAPDAGYGGQYWRQQEKLRENRRHRASQKAENAILTDAQGHPLDKPRRSKAARADFVGSVARPSMPPGTRKG